MDRETLIEKIMKITNATFEELNKCSDEELISFYQDLEDSGKFCDYND